MQKTVRLFLISMLVFFSALGFARADSTMHTLVPAKKNVEVLFVMLSQKANIHAVADKPGIFELTLTGVNPKVIYFSDRPVRMSSHLSVRKFVQEWETGSFKHSAPNAVMEAVKLNAHTKQPQKTESSYPIVLKHPVYHAKTNQLSFEIKALPGSNIALPASASSDYVAIFVDGVCFTCIGG